MRIYLPYSMPFHAFLFLLGLQEEALPIVYVTYLALT
jgi:hypothetical protein